MDNKQTAEFLPFNAINQFMIADYRQKVLHQVLGGLDQLPPGQKSGLVASIKRLFNVPGFRNPVAAPLLLKVRAAVAPFEKNAAFTAQVLMGWSELNSDLMQQVYHLLLDRKWELLPLDADRSKLPGFLTRWPKGETYEALNTAYNEQYPQSSSSEDDVRLMVVWISGRLPYEMVDTEDKAN
jgi:hypothetical protein